MFPTIKLVWWAPDAAHSWPSHGWGAGETECPSLLSARHPRSMRSPPSHLSHSHSTHRDRLRAEARGLSNQLRPRECENNRDSTGNRGTTTNQKKKKKKKKKGERERQPKRGLPLGNSWRRSANGAVIYKYLQLITHHSQPTWRHSSLNTSQERQTGREGD